MSVRYAWLLLFVLLGCGPARERVVVYCALDREFADDILRDFTQRTGLEVTPRYDTEANKAIGLYEDLVREAGRPRCDVHWNNEILASIRLANQGVYAFYDSPAAAPFPERYRAQDRTWTAFAARARVLLINTNLVKDDERPRRLADLTLPAWKGRVALAKPQFGTTATHAACLFQAWGDDKARGFFHGLKDNDARLLPGNKKVAVAVGLGQYAVGLTDTDDALAELDAGRPVAMLFPDADTLYIPNTVALVKGAPNPTGARRLIDYLLSAEVEAKLARAKGGQIPLNPDVDATLPAGMHSPRTLPGMDVDFVRAADGWDTAMKALRIIGY